MQIKTCLLLVGVMLAFGGGREAMAMPTAQNMVPDRTMDLDGQDNLVDSTGSEHDVDDSSFSSSSLHWPYYYRVEDEIPADHQSTYTRPAVKDPLLDLTHHEKAMILKHLSSEDISNLALLNHRHREFMRTHVHPWTTDHLGSLDVCFREDALRKIILKLLSGDESALTTLLDGKFTIDIRHSGDTSRLPHCFALIQELSASHHLIMTPVNINVELHVHVLGEIESALNLLQMDFGPVQITHLVVSHLYLADSDVEKIAAFLRHHKKIALKSLHVSTEGEGITDDGVQALAAVLRTTPTNLEAFDIRAKEITDDGANTLAKALFQNTHLKSFGIHSDLLTDEGANYLAEALQRNTVLQSFSWGGENELSDAGVLALIRGLRGNPNFKNLRLRHPGLTDRGAVALAEWIESEDCSLEYLSIRQNQISSSVQQRIARAFHDDQYMVVSSGIDAVLLFGPVGQ